MIPNNIYRVPSASICKITERIFEFSIKARASSSVPAYLSITKRMPKYTIDQASIATANEDLRICMIFYCNLTIKLRGAARRFIAQRPATKGSGFDRSVSCVLEMTNRLRLHSVATWHRHVFFRHPYQRGDQPPRLWWRHERPSVRHEPLRVS